MRITITCAALLFSYLAMTGCASVPMEGMEETLAAKKFNPPAEGKSGLYIYRNSFFNTFLKRDVWVNGKCIGETAPDVFFYEVVEGDTEHKVSTESEFSPNDLLIKVKSGMNYFIWQIFKTGVIVPGSELWLVDEEKGKKDVSELDMATKGTCTN